MGHFGIGMSLCQLQFGFGHPGLGLDNRHFVVGIVDLQQCRTSIDPTPFNKAW
jgi:hypothetical protein